MTREEHLRAIYIISSAKRGKHSGLLMLCSGMECGGAEVFVPGLTAAEVLAAADAHHGQMYGEADHGQLAAGEGGEE